MNPRATLHVEGFFDPARLTVSYLALDTSSRQCALIDGRAGPGLGGHGPALAIAGRLRARVRALGATVQWMLDTHGPDTPEGPAPHGRQAPGGRPDLAPGDSARPACRRFADGQRFRIGGLSARALCTPGHGAAGTSYIVSDAAQTVAFVGFTLCMPDQGTARCDGPGGDARTLFRSINRLLSLPPDTLLYLGHDDPPADRAPQFMCTVAEQREHNVLVRNGISEEAFVALRDASDARLARPASVSPSAREHRAAGQMPGPGRSGRQQVGRTLDRH